MISTLEKISKEVERQKSQDKKVGLITGCFDVLHFGHIQLFRFAKKHVDFLVVGLDNDKNVAISKGTSRPINRIKQRLEIVSELRSVDVVFEINEVFKYSSTKADKIHSNILKVVDPDYLITAIKADKFWKIKKQLAKHLHIKFLPDTQDKVTSTTKNG